MARGHQNKKPAAAPASASKHAQGKEATTAHSPQEVVRQRLDEIRNKLPALVSRISLLSVLAQLQDELGGEFPQHVAFVHMPDFILNVRRVGQVDVSSMTAALEVYDLGEIREGILWVPLDHIMWVGTTNEPLGVEKIGLESTSVSVYTPLRSKYERLRRKLAGLVDGDGKKK